MMTDVCILTTGHRTFDRRVFLKEARSLAEHGYNVKLVTHADKEEVRDGVEIVSLGTADSRFERWKHIPESYRIAKQLDSDIYHIHVPELLPVGVALSHTTSGKVVFDAHEDFTHNTIYYREWIPPVGQEVLSIVYPPIQDVFARQLDAVIATTETIAEGFRRKNYPNVTVVRNFPMTERVSIKRPLVEKDHEYILMYIGGLTETRGVMRMLKVTKQLRDRGTDVGLWLIGSYRTSKEEETKLEVEQYISKNNLSDSIRFFGRIPHEEVFNYLQVGDIGLSLLDKKLCEYCLPTKMIEYMYVGLPVVSTRTKTTEKYISEENGVLVSENISEITDSILELITKRNLEGMGENGRTQVTSKYNWESEEETLLNLYSRLLD